MTWGQGPQTIVPVAQAVAAVSPQVTWQVAPGLQLTRQSAPHSTSQCDVSRQVTVVESPTVSLHVAVAAHNADDQSPSSTSQSALALHRTSLHVPPVPLQCAVSLQSTVSSAVEVP